MNKEQMRVELVEMLKMLVSAGVKYNNLLDEIEKQDPQWKQALLYANSFKNRFNNLKKAQVEEAYNKTYKLVNSLRG